MLRILIFQHPSQQRLIPIIGRRDIILSRVLSDVWWFLVGRRLEEMITGGYLLYLHTVTRPGVGAMS